LFELLETGNRAAGMVPGGRIPGKVNINTIWDPETFLAMCDPQTSNNFTINQLYMPLWTGMPPVPAGYDDPNNPQTIFWQMIKSRSSPGTSLLAPMPGQNDQPFMGMGVGYTPAGTPNDIQNQPNGIGIKNTFLRPNPANTQSLFQISGANHPYLQDQLLTKLFNNVTTRSNVFAVWVTVGFFEVIDDSSRPVKLGAEIGKAENRHIRHRMFAIVDRSNLSSEANNPNQIGPPPIYISMSGLTSDYPATPYTYVVPNLTGSYEGIPWLIGQYTNLLVDTGANQEMVQVTAIPAPISPLPPNPNNLPPVQGITVTPFTKAHSSPVAITPLPTLIVSSPPNANPIPTGQQTVSITGPATPPSLNGIRAGVNVLVDFPANPEVVNVMGVTPYATPQLPTLTATFTKPHTTPFTITYPIPQTGNPGPQPSFNARQVPWVVRYFSTIN
jgi:hypothetical protein